jgi:hypothetical protein
MTLRDERVRDAATHVARAREAARTIHIVPDGLLANLRFADELLRLALVEQVSDEMVDRAAEAIYEAQRPALEREYPQSHFQRWHELQASSMREVCERVASAALAAALDSKGGENE